MFGGDYLVKGTHGERMRFLSQQANKNDNNENGFGLFNGGINLYIIAPLIGVLKNRKAEENTDGNQFKIFSDAFSNNRRNVETVYRLVLLSEKNDLSNDEKINRAFKSDADPEMSKANLNLFHSYMRGGIDWLYERIFDNSATIEDDYIANLLEMVEEFSEEYGIGDEI